MTDVRPGGWLSQLPELGGGALLNGLGTGFDDDEYDIGNFISDLSGRNHSAGTAQPAGLGPPGSEAVEASLLSLGLDLGPGGDDDPLSLGLDFLGPGGGDPCLYDDLLGDIWGRNSPTGTAQPAQSRGNSPTGTAQPAQSRGNSPAGTAQPAQSRGNSPAGTAQQPDLTGFGLPGPGGTAAAATATPHRAVDQPTQLAAAHPHNAPAAPGSAAPGSAALDLLLRVPAIQLVSKIVMAKQMQERLHVRLMEEHRQQIEKQQQQIVELQRQKQPRQKQPRQQIVELQQQNEKLQQQIDELQRQIDEAPAERQKQQQIDELQQQNEKLQQQIDEAPAERQKQQLRIGEQQRLIDEQQLQIDEQQRQIAAGGQKQQLRQQMDDHTGHVQKKQRQTLGMKQGAPWLEQEQQEQPATVAAAVAARATADAATVAMDAIRLSVDASEPRASPVELEQELAEVMSNDVYVRLTPDAFSDYTGMVTCRPAAGRSIERPSGSLGTIFIKPKAEAGGLAPATMGDFAGLTSFEDTMTRIYLGLDCKHGGRSGGDAGQPNQAFISLDLKSIALAVVDEPARFEIVDAAVLMADTDMLNRMFVLPIVISDKGGGPRVRPVSLKQLSTIPGRAMYAWFHKLILMS